MINIVIVGKRHLLPSNLPHIDIFNTICIVAASGLFSASLFLSLYGLFTEVSRPWVYSTVAFANGFLLVAMFLFFYYQFLFITRTINKIESAPNLFPILAEEMSKVKNPDDAEKFASVAYKMYGVRMAYANAENSQIYYVPSKNDTDFRSNIEKMDSAVTNLRHVSLGLLYGDADIVLTMFVTFFIGLCVATFRRKEPSPIAGPHMDSLKI